MSKIKVHEVAKKIGVNSKEVVERAKELGIDVKSHLSALEENDAKKLEESFGKVKKEVPEKTSGPVIIRRQVIMNEEEKTNKPQPEQTNKKGVGFVERDRKKDYNIVYRNRPTKPMSVSDLFGIPKKEEPKPEPKLETKPEKKPETKPEVVEEVKKEEPVVIEKPETKEIIEEKKVEESVEKKENNMKQEENNNYHNRPFNRDRRNNNNSFGNQNNRPYNRDERNNNFGNQNRPFNRDGRNNNFGNQNRPFNRDGRNNNFGNQNRPFNRDGRNNNFGNQNNRNGQYGQRRPLDERGVEKNIKNIMSADVGEKENVRDYASKAIDKQKNNNKYDENKQNKKNNKSRRNNYEDFSSHKLKDLKQENRLSNMFDEGSMLDYYDLTTTRGKRNKKKVDNSEERNKQKIFQLTEITIPESISVKDLATELKKTSGDIIKKLLGYGILATINNEVDFDTAFLIAQEFGVTAIKKEVVSDEEKLFDESEDREEDLLPRPPVVVVMGHVDHGKTSLLDAVRQTNVIEGEAGGITQAIGAYKVKINDREITFLDTPGHEAFTAMRARGAQITDIAILVVAANDGVMPQTIEAINHAKAADIPIIVAINKIDVEGANPQKVKQELMEYGLVAEEWGGDTIFVEISAKKKINIDGLLEMVLLVADMKELKANPNKQAKGVVIEAKLDKTKGAVATMLVQRGTLDVGDTIIVGSTIGRIRTMTDENGRKLKKAGPSTPVEITGFSAVPEAGETFYEVEDEKTAKHLIETRKRKEREKSLNETSRVTLDDLFSQIEKGNLKQLNLIVKADVQGSVEAVKSALEKLSNDEVKVKVIHANVGAVTESDVTLADVSNAIIIAFNVRPEPLAKDKAEKSNVEIKTYSVIYNAIEDVESAMKGLLDPVYKEVVIGNAEVRQTFKISNVGTIAGCYVTNGKVARNAGVRVIRDNVVIHEGKLVSLKRMKDDAKEVAHGFECGIQIENFNDIKEMDVIEAYIMEQVK
ncbi:MAG: translation initiation factor IF-2 [Clostridia bacterium]|nr:translation initiation factor IF-2 [Clostridia bacterium]